ncbi:MAG: fused MFS/spermidine synthase [Alcanivorax sp.]
MKLYVPVFSVTLLLSAVLLFTVQPMFSKMILPYLGGAPQTWNTSMLFFQMCLLAGYAYAHGTTRYLSVRSQAILHVILLAIFVVVLPVAVPQGWEPPGGDDPTLWQLSLMATVVGGPFFVVSGSAPMLQRWFSITDHKDAHDPYFLYGASNLGSMSGLLLYPVLVEPMMTINSQSTTWMYGYISLIVLTILCTILIWKYNQQQDQVNSTTNKIEDTPVTNQQRIKWIILSFIPSTLMLGVTTHITTEVASVPLLWVMPLALYIGTFILVFARKPLFTSNQIMLACGIGVAVLCAQHIALKNMHDYPVMMIALRLFVFFLLALACHTSLAESRPSARRLTEFYLIMSFGGALGGFFNAIIVPNYVIVPVEYPLMLIAAVLVRYINVPEQSFATLLHTVKSNPKQIINLNNILLVGLPLLLSVIGMIILGKQSVEWLSAIVFLIGSLIIVNRRWAFALIIIPAMMIPYIRTPGTLIYQDRDFFGVIRITETEHERILLHGSTNHGTQPTSARYPLTKISYYGDTSPVSDLFKIADMKEGPQRVAVMGLGIGVTACYTKEGRHFDFYEIDRKIADLAENEKFFTYMSDCESPYDIILGDGRLMMEKQPDERYDFILIDVFSSDNIPMHLLTKEAVEIYLSKLKKEGLLLMHISNRFLDLEPIIAEIGEQIGVPTFSRVGIGEMNEKVNIKTYDAHFAAFTYNPDIIEKLQERTWTPARKREGVKAWTDQYSNIINSFNNRTANERMVARYKLREEENKQSSEQNSTEGSQE